MRSRRPPATRREVLSSWSDEEALPSWDGGGGNDHGGGGLRSRRAPRDSVLAPAPRGMILEDAEDGEIGIEDQGLRVAPGSGGPPSQPSGAPSAATPASSLLRYSPHHSPFRSPADLLDKDEEAVAGEGEDEEDVSIAAATGSGTFPIGVSSALKALWMSFRVCEYYFGSFHDVVGGNPRD